MRTLRRVWLKLLAVVFVSCCFLVVGPGSDTVVEADGPDEEEEEQSAAVGWAVHGLRALPFASLGESTWWLLNKSFGGQEARSEDVVGCWVTGGLDNDEGDSWSGVGDSGDEFVGDMEDGRNAGVERPQGGDFELQVQKHGKFFRSVPELIDYTFALDLRDRPESDLNVIDDQRVREVRELVLGRGVLGDNRRVPWGSRKEYLSRRPVANWVENRLVHFGKHWKDPDNPAGGTSTDFGELSRDLIAGQADAAVATTTLMGQGGETTFVQQQVPVMALQGVNNRIKCEGRDGGTTCNSDQEVKSESKVIELRALEWQQNTGEVEERHIGLGERPAIVDETLEVMTVEIDFRDQKPNQSIARSRSLLGYGSEGARDLGNSSMEITVELDEDLRSDFEWSVLRDGKKSDAPGFGWDVWTYENIAGQRHWTKNSLPPPVTVGERMGYGEEEEEVEEDEDEEAVPEDGDVLLVANSGYRQPVLNRMERQMVVSDGDVRTNVEHVKWPVNVEDMNWYLYEIPGAPGSALFYYWLSLDGGQRLAWGGYGEGGIPSPPDNLPAEEVFEPECTLEGVTVEQHNIKCEGELPDTLKDVKDAVSSRVYYPFDTMDAEIGDDVKGLNRHMLVRAGVESALDQGSGPGAGGRTLSLFKFEISEGDAKEAVSGREEGDNRLKRLGVPENEVKARDMLAAWPDGNLNPNGVYLLVLTFYETRYRDGLEFVYKNAAGLGPWKSDDARGMWVPKREVRRVVCRVVVRNIGFETSGTAGTTAIEYLTEKVRAMMTDVGQDIRRLVADGARGLMKSPPWVGRKMADVECSGMDRLDQLTVGGPSAMGRPEGEVVEGVRKVAPGELVVNEAVTGRHNGIEECERVGEERKVTCNSSLEFAFRGRCTELPKMEIMVRGGKFLDLQNQVTYLRHEWHYRDENGVRHRKPRSSDYYGHFSPTLDPAGAERPNERNRGLSRLHVGWEPKWEGLHGDVMRELGGWKIIAFPDQRSVNRLVPPEGEVFYLPRLIVVEEAHNFRELSQVYTERRHYLVDGFHFGGLGLDEEGVERVGDHFWPARDSDVVAGAAYDVMAVGGNGIGGEYERFNRLLDRLPLTTGYVHSFIVLPFVGKYGTTNFHVGSSDSNKLVLDGGQAGCYTRLDGHGAEPGTFAMHPKVGLIYQCKGGESDEEGSSLVGRPFGLLGLLGTEACGDIFSSTPAEFTWDNPVVRNVWVLMLVIGGGVLFTLLVWQGLRMTYDVWLDPQPAVGMRELVPRFLLAVVLAAGSLAICELVLVLASDVTCFVAQATGMTMWGFLGTTIGSMLWGFVAWMDSFQASLDGLFLPALLGWGMVVFILALVIVIFVIGVLILFLMVAFAMLTRIALLAVLVAFAPLAFAFYASNVTSHWTKLWVSMFLGTAFQQVFVLLVVFLGGNLLGAYMKTGAEGEFDTLVIGLILAALTLMLALKVPEIVNPKGQGMFRGFSQMGQMAIGGAMMLGGVAVGATMGALGAGAGLAAGAAGGARGVGMRMQGGGRSGDSGGGGGGDATGGAAGGGVPRGPVSPTGGGGAGVVGNVSTGGFRGGPAASSPAGSSPSSSGASGSGPSGAATGSGSSSGGNESGEKKPGFIERTYGGARRGARFAGGMNTRMRDLSSGGFLFRGGSTGDDAAAQVSRLRGDQSGRAASQAEAYNKMAEVLNKLNQRLP